MYTVKIIHEYLHGPIWVYGSDGVSVWEYPLIHNDAILAKLNEQAADMFDGYYEFNTHDVPCWLKQEKEKAEKEIMLDLITQIVARLNEINDGSFVIEDLETERLKSL